ncbi:histone-lysine N-methyltransferase SETD7-like isoform X2 [Tigriopus californicus]|uniref:histone-lysine N-methyltransferase SETD7-like isoform X2 n=1 Tax=Tigriopus californicus TaxID=6832 RepID=UPI0027D9D8AE|nr:histone-lysine N-methyltransferase SETD7-like isoform X2 [Tigriopus californicus]
MAMTLNLYGTVFVLLSFPVRDMELIKRPEAYPKANFQSDKSDDQLVHEELKAIHPFMSRCSVSNSNVVKPGSDQWLGSIGSSLRQWIHSIQPKWIREQSKLWQMGTTQRAHHLGKIVEARRAEFASEIKPLICTKEWFQDSISSRGSEPRSGTDENPGSLKPKAKKKKSEKRTISPEGKKLRFLDISDPPFKKDRGSLNGTQDGPEFEYLGKTMVHRGSPADGRKLFHGEGSLRFLRTPISDNNNQGGTSVQRNGRPRFRFPWLDSLSIREIKGTFCEGQLQGTAWIELDQDILIEANFLEGVLHGPIMVMGLSDGHLVDPLYRNTTEDGENGDEYYVQMVGSYKMGNPLGPMWFFYGNDFQMFQYFELDANHEPGLWPDYGAFLYPDLETAILGQFHQRVLLRGQGSRVIGEACQNGWIRDLTFELPRAGSPHFKYGPPSHYSFGHGPQLSDPYEDQSVRVGRWSAERTMDHKKALFDPDLEEGLFAKRDIKKGQTVAFYSGLVIPCDLELYGMSVVEPTESEDNNRTSYLLSLIQKDGTSYCLDIPPEYGRDVRRYRATLGHKTNHSFHPNSIFREVPMHPRFGFIMSLVAKRDIAEGEEILVNYNYELEEAPKWFQNLYQERTQSKAADYVEKKGASKFVPMRGSVL